MDPTTLPLTVLSRLLRANKLNPVDLVEAHIARIATVNPAINAVVATRYDAARAEAEQATKALAQGDPRPLLGIPCTVKEFLAVQDMPHTSGIVARQHRVAHQDATVVRRLRQAGAIILGTTNAPEGGLWHETVNRIYGRTSNPWDVRRTSGGSSGGSGAIVAAGGSVFGLGSDVGGSVRYPAAFCGTFAHKPTSRSIPSTGHHPDPVGERVYPFTIGPLTRSATDLAPLLRVLMGPDDTDPITVEMPLDDPASVDISTLQLYVVRPQDRPRIQPPIAAAMRRAQRALVARGATLHTIALPRLRQAVTLWATMLSNEGVSYQQIVGEGGRVPLLRELLAYPLGRSRHQGPVLLTMALEKLLHRLPSRDVLDEIEALRHDLELAIGDGVLLHPTFSRTAPRHRAILFHLLDAACTTAFNLTESPVTVVPMGLCPKGLPIGLQLVARRGADAKTLALAMALEQDFGGWRRATPRRGRQRLALV